MTAPVLAPEVTVKLERHTRNVEIPHRTTANT
jgi:hypothetical protein